MKVLVVTPTKRWGGADVYEASLLRQKYRDFEIIVFDEYAPRRSHIWEGIAKNNLVKGYTQSKTPIEEGYKRNLSKNYNKAAQIAVDYNFDLFISLQDYIWIPEDGIERFVWLSEQRSNDLLTGVTHISRDPWPNTIKYPLGMYSLWDEPYTEKPKRIGWTDARVSDIYRGFPENSVIEAEQSHWEANWAAIPVKLLKDGLKWNEDYDKGVAYENQDFAQRATKEYGSKILFDTSNIAISLPHKEYFMGEREEIIEFSNRNRYEEDWNISYD